MVASSEEGRVIVEESSTVSLAWNSMVRRARRSHRSPCLWSSCQRRKVQSSFTGVLHGEGAKIDCAGSTPYAEDTVVLICAS